MQLKMDDATEARLAAIETVLGIMIAHMPKEDVAVIIKALRTTTEGARRNPQMREHAVPALQNLDDILCQWSKQAPLLPRNLATPGQSTGD